MTIPEGEAELEKIRNAFAKDGEIVPFVVIFNECKLDGELFRNLFRFLRNIMKSLNICFVGMGTNVDVCNFTGTYTNSSRINVGVWCHLIFKLPKIAHQVLENTKKRH